MMGALMGLMMLGMVHLMLQGNSELAGTALAVFVAVHIAILLSALCLGVWATRHMPRLASMLARLHRPSIRHFAQMLGAAAFVAFVIHLSLHGGL
ncbi:hypothetical protein C1J03_18485 [Sulfitobacter sp. SK012]|nr:hypothetical protein C1J03_18485 [Sulfitobacter sp. SK012]